MTCLSSSWSTLSDAALPSSTPRAEIRTARPEPSALPVRRASSAQSPRERAAGVDIISLGIGDPDLPTPAHIVAAARGGRADASTHRYPTNQGGRRFARPWPATTQRASASISTRPPRSSPCSAPRRASPTSALPSSTRATSALPPIPAIPSTSTGPLIAGGTAVHLPLVPSSASSPISRPSTPAFSPGRRCSSCGYPNNPTGAVIEDDFFERLVAFGRRQRHRDRARQRLRRHHLRRLRRAQLPRDTGRQGGRR